MTRTPPTSRLSAGVRSFWRCCPRRINGKSGSWTSPSDPVPGEDVDPDGSSGGSASSGGYQPVNHNLLCTTDPDAANNHGFKRSRWRGLRWQKVQDWLIACCQNLRILVSNRIPDRARAAQQSVKTALIICFKVSWNELSPIFAPVRYLRPILGM